MRIVKKSLVDDLDETAPVVSISCDKVVGGPGLVGPLLGLGGCGCGCGCGGGGFGRGCGGGGFGRGCAWPWRPFTGF